MSILPFKRCPECKRLVSPFSIRYAHPARYCCRECFDRMMEMRKPSRLRLVYSREWTNPRRPHIGVVDAKS